MIDTHNTRSRRSVLRAGALGGGAAAALAAFRAGAAGGTMPADRAALTAAISPAVPQPMQNLFTLPDLDWLEGIL
jgi:hypothetical protein